MNQDYMYMIQDMTENMASASGFSSLLGIAAYVFSALAIYNIAQRRGIKKAWMAWVPVVWSIIWAIQVPVPLPES